MNWRSPWRAASRRAGKSSPRSWKTRSRKWSERQRTQRSRAHEALALVVGARTEYDAGKEAAVIELTEQQVQAMSGLGRLQELERQIHALTYEEQLWLVEHVAHGLRAGAAAGPRPTAQELSAIAADPEVQEELRQIDQEFVSTEQDGLK